MKKFNCARLLVGAMNSGAGKTTVVCALLEALKNRGKNVVSFKCGPDYIDPMFHREVMNIPSSNLDLFFNEENTIKYLMKEHISRYNGDFALIEGVMGYFDGIGGTTDIASSYHLAKVTDTPSILVVDSKGKSYSLVAEIKGFLDFEKNKRIKGVILNRVSPMMYPRLKKVIEDELDIKVLGFLPKSDDIGLESRHLGLVTAKEIGNLNEILKKLGELAEKYIDIDEIIKIGYDSKELEYEEIEIEKLGDVNIGVALDKAFSFYYEANIRLLEKLGANITYFSPVNSSRLPENLDGILIGGGYPELYLKELESNKSMRVAIKNAIEKGMPTLAECGGFMYLHKTIKDRDDKSFEMVGIFEESSYPTGSLGRFGYIDISLNQSCIIGEKDNRFKGHEFHYWDSENNGNLSLAQKPLSNRKWECMHSYKNLVAGYPHIHYYSNLDMAKNYILKCLEYKSEKEKAYV